MPVVIVVASGLLTGCVGGVLRDILCNDVPLLFRSELYATISVVTGAIYVAGLRSGVPAEATAAVAMIAGFVLRLVAIRFRLSMPKFIYEEHEQDRS